MRRWGHVRSNNASSDGGGGGGCTVSGHGQGRSKEIIIAVSEKVIQILTDDIQSLWRQYQNLHPS